MVVFKVLDTEELTPDHHVQRDLITQYIGQQLAAGQTWYLVDSDWYKKFKQYVGLEDSVCIGVDQPGPIDNSPLFSNYHLGTLKEHLMEPVDYVLLPEEAWKLLVEWYGMTSKDTEIKRQVVEYGPFIKCCDMEIYLVHLRLCKDFDYHNELSHNFSIVDPVSKIENTMRTMFQIPNNVNSRLWGYVDNDVVNLLTKPNNSIRDEGIFQNQLIVIETPKEDGTWYRQPSMTPSSVLFAANTSSNSEASSSALPSAPTISLIKQVTKPGLCGLTNLGNTCFMNSTIQCMSNCPPLTDYFIHNEYLKELNVRNPLGMEGEIAQAFANLIKMMWSGEHTYTTPHQFKVQVGRFAPQFCGYQQHDAQELLTFLLDGLHEDLNRVEDKPYIETNHETSGTDEEMAAVAWTNYKKRNDSIIVDFFHGLLKSTVICPDCNNTSITFDPFCYLSLPLPRIQNTQIQILFFPEELKPLKFTLELPNNGTVQDLIDCLANLRRANPRSFIALEVINHHFHKRFSNDETLESIHDTDKMYVYEIPLNYQPQLILPVYMYESSEKNVYEKRLFGYPFLISLSKDRCTNSMLYDIIWSKICQFYYISDSSQDMRRYHRKEDTSIHDVEECVGDSNIFESAFSLHLINKTGTKGDIIEIREDNKSFQFTKVIGNTYIAATWHVTVVKKFCFNINFTEVTSEIKHSESKPVQLADCLKLCTALEMLSANDAWYCSGCKKHQLATKKFDLWRLPKILIMHLNRFSYCALHREKINIMVHFPLKDLNLSEFVIDKKHPKIGYNLIGVSNHYGKMGGGHYTAFCQNKIDKKWYLFDDVKISKTTEDDVVSQNAYVLFYMQCDESTPLIHDK